MLGRTALALIVTTLACGAQTRLARPAPKEAILFKSGQAWLEREYALGGGEVRLTTALPDAIHGTVWLGSGTHRVVRAVSRRIDETVDRRAATLAELVGAGAGRTVQLELQAGQEVRTLSGRLGDPLRGENGQPQILDLEVEEGQHAYVPISRVLSVFFRDGAAPQKATSLRRTGALDVSCESEGAAGTLRLGWMTGGLAWAPSWELALDGTEGVLAGKAVIINDAVDLENTRVRLVVGYPNLRFGAVRSPLSPDLSFDQFRRAILGLRGNDQIFDSSPLSNVLGQTVVQSGNWGGQRDAGAAPEPLPATAAEDLWIYDARELTLKKGERAYLPLLRRGVKVRHRYDWELEDHIDARARFVPREDTPAVWHELVLRNDSVAPWTTAPVLVTGAQGPLAQSQLDYTPVGSEAEVRLTKALDIVPDAAFEVVDRDRETERFFGRNYERITVRGTLKLVNRKNETVRVRVTKRLSGEVVADGDATDSRVEPAGLRGINPTSVLTWEFELEAEQSWTATFDHRVLVQR